MQANTFDEVLDLEEQFYNNGYEQGVTDGISAGRIEGRTFGLEKGFEKYLESGRLYGKSLVWANRMSQLRKKSQNVSISSSISIPASIQPSPDPVLRHPRSLHPLPNHPRLAKHLQVLHALSESESLFTVNTEEAVSDFDDRLKRAQGKAKIIERMINEAKVEVDGGSMTAGSNLGSFEDIYVSRSTG